MFFFVFQWFLFSLFTINLILQHWDLCHVIYGCSLKCFYPGWEFSYRCLKILKKYQKQECIQVECVLPSAVAVPGGWGLHQAPPRSRPPAADLPQRSRPPWDQAPFPLLTESQTPVKTLPCPSFVAGDNYVLRCILTCDSLGVNYYGNYSLNNCVVLSTFAWTDMGFVPIFYNCMNWKAHAIVHD